MYETNKGRTTASVELARPSFSSDPTTASETATDRLVGALESAANRIHGSIDRVRGFADHMLGEAGPDKGMGPANPPRSGRAGQLQDRVDQIHASLSTLESEIERLSGI